MAVRTAPPNTKPLKSDSCVPIRPTSKLGLFFWRWRMWFESTFVLSMLEPWEKVLLLTIFALLFVLISSAFFKYMPHHILFLRRRAIYYLWGQEGDERMLWQWLGLVSADASNTASNIASGAAALHKEL